MAIIALLLNDTCSFWCRVIDRRVLLGMRTTNNFIDLKVNNLIIYLSFPTLREGGSEGINIELKLTIHRQSIKCFFDKIKQRKKTWKQFKIGVINNIKKKDRRCQGWPWTCLWWWGHGDIPDIWHGSGHWHGGQVGPHLPGPDTILIKPSHGGHSNIPTIIYHDYWIFLWMCFFRSDLRYRQALFNYPIATWANVKICVEVIFTEFSVIFVVKMRLVRRVN